MLLQFGAIFSSVLQQVLPAALDVGRGFLDRELGRKDRRRAKNQAKAQAIAALNTPGISVARVGGTLQPVGGRVQRSTFFPAAQTPAQSPLGNIPLLPVGFPGMRGLGPGFGQQIVPGPGPFVGRRFGGSNLAGLNGAGPLAVRGAPGEPRFALDERGKTIMFVPDPSGGGFLPVSQARQLGLSAMKPWWRFNRLTSRFEKMKSRRMNPFNFKAASRAGRRIERTLDAIKDVVSIQRKMEKGVSAGGKVIKFRAKKRKKA